MNYQRLDTSLLLRMALQYEKQAHKTTNQDAAQYLTRHYFAMMREYEKRSAEQKAIAEKEIKAVGV